jgi:hypothetical protein
MTFNWNSEKFQRPSMNAAPLTAGRRFIFAGGRGTKIPDLKRRAAEAQKNPRCRASLGAEDAEFAVRVWCCLRKLRKLRAYGGSIDDAKRDIRSDSRAPMGSTLEAQKPARAL